MKIFWNNIFWIGAFIWLISLCFMCLPVMWIGLAIEWTGIIGESFYLRKNGNKF